jgi:DNA polymerase-3 subunit delta'
LGFGNITGQNKIKDILYSSIIEERLSHAYAFCGPAGIGKRTMAQDFGKLLLCTNTLISAENGKNILSECNKCDSCMTFESGTNPDFNYIETSDDSIKIDTIRNMQKDILLAPMYGNKKVYIICDAHKMTHQAQNCLLKTLEEPPQNVVILLTVSIFENLLETIRSRIFKLDFIKNSDEEVREVVLKKIGMVENLNFIISYCDGNIGSALKIIQNEDLMEMRTKITNYILDNCTKSSQNNLEGISILEEYKENIDEALDIIEMFFRDVLVIKTGSNQNILINSDKKDIIKRNFVEFSTDKIISCIDLIDKVRGGLHQNANFSLAIEYLVLGLNEEFL